MGNEIAMQRSLSDVIEEYNFKINQVKENIEKFKKAGVDLMASSCIGGTYSQERIDVGSVYEQTVLRSLLKSAWLHVYNGLNINRIASANDKRKFEQSLADPAPFTMENLRATFGDFIADPHGNILRGLAEAFCCLDPAYKSHDKVKIGVEGLPKRVILTNVGGYGSWGRDRLENILNALASYQRKPLMTYAEMELILKDENALLKDQELEQYDKTKIKVPARGVRLRRFSNGNGHLFFEKDTLRDINKALAEYYGEVLPDCAEAKPTQKQKSTAVSKDLQYYPTPVEVVNRVVDDLGNLKDKRILEPSCGCGRFMDALRDAGAKVVGVEVDPPRVLTCKAKGHAVIQGNFLETAPSQTFDKVVMNPPFYGKHYFEHVKHALKFLKEGGELVAILPVTARYDHGLIETLPNKARWEDLPLGSFRESGTNINTTVLRMWG